MKQAIFILFCLILASCNAEKHAARKDARHAKRAYKLINRASLLSPMTGSDWCAKNYPPLDSVHETIVYKPGQTIVKPGATKYVQIDCDSAIAATKLANTHSSMASSKPHTFSIPCPPDSMRIDTIQDLRFESKVNRAQIYSLQARSDSLKSVIAQKDATIAAQGQKIADKNKHIMWLWVVIGGYILLRIIRFYLNKYTNILKVFSRK